MSEPELSGSARGRTTQHEVAGLAVTRRPRSPGSGDDGAGGHPTVVFVHGAMDRSASFGRTARRLDGLDVVSYDRRGYAGSLDAGTAGGVAGHAADLAAIIDWTGAPRVAVVGHSLGGTIALELAGRDDRRIAAVLAFESPMPSLDGSHGEVGGGAVAVAERDGPAAGAEHFSRLMLGDATWERLRERDRLARLAEGPALLDELVDLRRADRPTPAAPPTVSITVGAGGRSSAMLREAARRLHEHIGGSGFAEIAGAGHGAHLTHPDEFARLARSVAAQVAPSLS